MSLWTRFCVLWFDYGSIPFYWLDSNDYPWWLSRSVAYLFGTDIAFFFAEDVIRERWRIEDLRGGSHG